MRAVFERRHDPTFPPTTTTHVDSSQQSSRPSSSCLAISPTFAEPIQDIHKRWEAEAAALGNTHQLRSGRRCRP